MNDSFLNIREERGVAVVELSRGVTNAINPKLIIELSSAMRELSQNDLIDGFLLTSSNTKFFSIGLDIPSVYDLSIVKFREFYRSFTDLCLQILSIPKPVIAAITGHAIAGGYILALCCDYRFIAEGRKLVGLNEIKLGVPVPYVADCMLRHLVGYRIARDVMDKGEFFEPSVATKLGLVDQVTTPELLIPASVEEVYNLSAHSPEAYSLIKRNRIEPILDEVKRGLDDRESNFVELWYSESSRHLLREAMAKF